MLYCNTMKSALLFFKKNKSLYSFVKCEYLSEKEYNVRSLEEEKWDMDILYLQCINMYIYGV